MISKALHTTLCTILALTAINSFADGTDGVQTRLQAEDLVVVQAGESIYRTHCAACHGQYLEGQPDWRTRDAEGYLPAPPHDASGHTWHHRDDLLFEITKYGAAIIINDPDYKTRMPAFDGILSDEDIVAVLSYIKNSWPDEQRQWQEQTNGSAQFELPETPSDSNSILDKLFK